MDCKTHPMAVIIHTVAKLFTVCIVVGEYVGGIMCYNDVRPKSCTCIII